MAEFGFYSFSEPLGPGIDFFTVDEALTLSSNIIIESNVSVNITKESFANSNIAVQSNISVVSIKIVFAQSNIVVDGATLTLGTRVKLAQSAILVSSNASVDAIKQAFAQSAINSNSQVTTSIKKEALAQSVISSNVSVSAAMIKEAKASAVISALSNTTVVARRVRSISSSLSGNVNLTIVGKISLATIKINILNNSNIVAQTIRFSNSITADSTLVRSLLMLDGVPLTNQSRRLDVQANPIYIENSNWQGDSSRYYKNTSSGAGAKRVFSLQWSFIPNYENKTVDLRASRNYINRKSKDGDVHTLTIIKQDESGTTPYTEENIDVLITDYTEDLIRRDLVDDVYYFNCAMSLQEV
jgi:hypothetical protein